MSTMQDPRELNAAEVEVVAGGALNFAVSAIDLDDWCGTGRPKGPPIPPRGLGDFGREVVNGAVLNRQLVKF